MKRIYVVLMALSLVLAACGDGTTDTTSSSGTQDTEATASTTSTTAGSDGIDLGEDGVLTLDDFFPGGGMDFSETDYRAQEMEIQQQVSVCMAAEGFEYVPYVPSDIGGGFGYEEFDEEEYVKTYGFGIATQVLQEEQYAEQYAHDEESDPWADDPNHAIVEAMDEFEQEEYYRLLHGGQPEIIENTPMEELDAMTPEERDEFYEAAYLDWEPTGCMNEAYEEAYGGGEDHMAFWDEFGQDFEDTYARVESDPRIVEAQAGWSSCMAEKGHDYATQEDMYLYFWGGEVGGQYVEGEFQQRVNELVTWPWSDLEDESFSEDGTSSVVVTSFAVVTEEGEEGEFEYPLPEYDIELLQPLIDEELGVATANFECSRDMQKIWEEVYKEIEQQFIEENLDRLLAFHETSG